MSENFLVYNHEATARRLEELAETTGLLSDLAKACIELRKERAVLRIAARSVLDSFAYWVASNLSAEQDRFLDALKRLRTVVEQQEESTRKNSP